MKSSSALIGAVALTALLLSGCSQAPSSGSAGSSSVAVAPAPTADQVATLREELRKVNPALDTPRTLPNAMILCRMASSGTPEEVQRERANKLFFGNGEAPAGAADQIIGVIETNGFCQT